MKHTKIEGSMRQNFIISLTKEKSIIEYLQYLQPEDKSERTFAQTFIHALHAS